MSDPGTGVRRVVFVSHTDTTSGAEKVLLTLAEAALARGDEVVIACPTGQLSAAAPPGARHLRLPKLGLSGAHGWRRCLGMLRLLACWVRAASTLRPLCTDPATRIVVNSLFALPALRLTLRRRCCTWLVHDTLSMRKQRIIARISAPAVARAVAVSATTASRLAPFGFPAVVSYNGVPLRPKLPAASTSQPVVGVLAKLTPWKGHRIALQAMRSVPGVTIEFAGDGFPGDEGHIAELRALADAPELAGRVRFLGLQDPMECLARWTALVSPSVEPEAGPLGILEAMSAGRAVIASDLGGSAEYLQSGAGILVPPGDPHALAAAIRMVVRDQGLRKNLVDRGHARVRQLHDIERTVPQMLALLTEDLQAPLCQPGLTRAPTRRTPDASEPQPATRGVRDPQVPDHHVQGSDVSRQLTGDRVIEPDDVAELAE